jgi:hypothetical protein
VQTNQVRHGEKEQQWILPWAALLMSCRAISKAPPAHPSFQLWNDDDENNDDDGTLKHFLSVGRCAKCCGHARHSPTWHAHLMSSKRKPTPRAMVCAVSPANTKPSLCWQMWASRAIWDGSRSCTCSSCAHSSLAPETPLSHQLSAQVRLSKAQT